MTVVKKIGKQAEDDPFLFVMSTDAQDRHGDIVEQDWRLAEFKENPIALFGHDASRPIGTWQNVAVRAGRLVGKLIFAEPGTDPEIDKYRKLVEQRILKAVSVGFLPGTAEALDEDDPWKGLRLSKNTLMECSLVSVGANPEALSLAKSLDVLPSDVAESGDDGALRCAAEQLGIKKASSRVSGVPKSEKHMRISDRIAATEALIKEHEDAIDALNEEMGDNLSSELLAQMDEHTAALDEAKAALKTLQAAEKATLDRLERQRKQTDPDDALEELETKQIRQEVRHRRIELRSTKPKGWGVMTGLACMMKAHGSNMSAEAYASEMRDNPEVAAFVKAAVNPADTATAGWAAELVQETWGEFIELVRDTSVYPNVLGPRMPFDRYGKIHLPRNEGRGSLAGDFVAEGGWIPVKEGSYGSTDMQPKDIGIISTYTKRIMRHSIPQIEQLIRTQFLADTAEVIDTRFGDNGARTATRPAGLQDPTETGVGNINAVTPGGTVANIEADVEALIGRVYDARLGMTGQWLMNRKLTLALSKKQDAASGVFVYKSEIAQGLFSGYPVVQSMNLPDNVVYFVAGDTIGHGEAQAPEITVDDSTALHINDAPTGPPDWSAFQTNSVAIKLDMGMDWRIYRQGGVQVLTGVDW